LLRDQAAGGDPLTASVASGIKVARARFWLEQGTWEPVASMPREKPKWKPHEGQSTDAGHRGGWARSSVEVPVMGMERRGPITQLRCEVNPAMGRNLMGKRDYRSGDKSRMRRESHVRFREGLGVKFPRATRLLLGFAGPKVEAEELKVEIRDFLTERLRLSLSEKKTLITHATTEKARFLGYELRSMRSNTKVGPSKGGGLRRSVNGLIGLYVPKDAIESRCKAYMADGRPTQRTNLLHASDYQIVTRYQGGGTEGWSTTTPWPTTPRSG